MRGIALSLSFFGAAINHLCRLTLERGMRGGVHSPEDHRVAEPWDHPCEIWRGGPDWRESAVEKIRGRRACRPEGRASLTSVTPACRSRSPWRLTSPT